MHYGVRQEQDWNALSDEQFRAILRPEIEAHYRDEIRNPSRRLLWKEQSDWYLWVAARGWIAPQWPREFGGMGLDSAKLLVFYEELERWGVARFQDHGIRMIGPMLIQHGTEEQQQRLLPPILRCEHRYCQGYSEPEAGSDLVSLRTTAQRHADGWIINGSKIWTTMAHDSTHIFVLARTSDTGTAHQQLSFFLADLATPGVTVRPIIDMAGEAELCEVFFEEVMIPADNLIGAENHGWEVANSVLGFERIHVGSPQLPESGLRQLARALDNARNADTLSVDAYAELDLDVAHLSAAYADIAQRMARGERLGSEVSLLKIVATETFQRIAETIIDTAGPAGGLRTFTRPDGQTDHVLASYYRARPSTLYGGTSEVQRNIVATRVLGLPRMRSGGSR